MRDPAPLGCVAIVGSGQIGTMLGLALRASAATAGVREILLYDVRPGIAEESLARGAGDRLAGSLEEALGAESIILAVPVPQIVDLIDHLVAGPARPGKFVIDTGSAKDVVTEAMRRLPAGVHAVGGHPIAGTERPGPAGAEPRRLGGATFVLTPARDDPEALRRGRSLAEAVGARPLVMDAIEHDRALAVTSHAPHMVAFALALAASADGAQPAARPDLVGSGFRGTTRLAASDPAMAAGFLTANAAATREALARFRRTLDRLESSLDAPEALGHLLAEARVAREALVDAGPAPADRAPQEPMP
jgi:prephenate dehydrogenase